jgi:hypothetical protein
VQRIRRQRIEHPAHVQADEHPNPRPVADADSDRASDAHADPAPDANPNAASNSESDAHAHAEPDAEPHPDPRTGYVQRTARVGQLVGLPVWLELGWPDLDQHGFPGGAKRLHGIVFSRQQRPGIYDNAGDGNGGHDVYRVDERPDEQFELHHHGHRRLRKNRRSQRDLQLQLASQRTRHLHRARHPMSS